MPQLHWGLRLLIAVAFVSIGLNGQAQNTVDWSIWRQVSIEDSNIILNLNDQKHFGMSRTGKSEGKFLGTNQAFREATDISRDGIDGGLAIFESDTFWNSDTTASSILNFFNATKNIPFERTDNGSFTIDGLEYRWVQGNIQFPTKPRKCNSFVTSRARSKIIIQGYYCSENLALLTEPLLRSFIGAIGYKDLKKPVPYRLPGYAPVASPIGQPPQPPGAPAASRNVEDRLAQIKSLLDRGLMTPAEYEQKRKEIISGI